MEYLTKSMRLDEEVIGWLDKLKSMHGSYNKGLRLVAFPADGRSGPPVGTTAIVSDCEPDSLDELPAARELLVELEKE